MTRETKIGLLVGLAFIIVIGILLADYSANGAKPPQAIKTGTAQNVRDSARLPASRQLDPGPLAVPDTVPVRTIVIGDEPRANPQQDVIVRPSLDLPSRTITSDPLPPITRTQTPTFEGYAEPIAIRPEPDHTDPISFDDPAPTPDTTDYVAKPGDTVIRMATKLLGANTKANRDALIRANPSLAAPPHRVVAGQTYKIPQAFESTNPVSVSDLGPTLPPAPAPEPKATLQYTTKPGDNLWKIAVEQCGSGSLVGKIRELNKDLLKGDIVRPNVTLTLPAKAH